MKVSIANMTFKQYTEFVKAMKDADFEKAGNISSVMVDTNFSELDFEEAVPTLQTIAETLSTFFSNVDTSPVTVSLKGWKWKDFSHFQKLVANTNLETALESIRTLVLIDGNTLAPDPSFQEGVMAIKAVSDKVGKVFSAKN